MIEDHSKFINVQNVILFQSGNQTYEYTSFFNTSIGVIIYFMICMNNKTDIADIIHGDEKALERFMRANYDRLFHYAYGLTKNQEVAEEIVSDAYLKRWKKRHELNRITNINSWLATIVHHDAVSWLRKENGRRFISLSELPDFKIPPFSSPDSQMISNEEIARINGAISTLPSRNKQIFFLARIVEMPYSDIANMLGVSLKTIYNNVSIAVDAVAKALDIKSE